MPPSRRSFLKRLASAGVVPVVGSYVLTDPFFVAGPGGVLVPGSDVAISPDEPLVIATDVAPDIVSPIEAWVTESRFDATRMTFDAMRYGDLHRAVVYGPAEVRVRLDLLLKSDVLSRDQLYSMLSPRGHTIKLWVDPGGR